MRKFAVILAGCGRKDGSEINEAITLLLSLEQHHCEYQCFAPNRPQTEVIDHLTDKKVKEERNILTEAARLARSNVRPVEEYKAEDYDGLLFSGGYGVAKNLCNYAYKGADMEVQPDVARAIVETREANKPIGGMCIAPVMFAKLLPGVCVTLGNEGTPDAVAERKNLLRMVTHTDDPFDPVFLQTSMAIANQRVSKAGQEGMTAFFEKRKPEWDK